MKQVIIQCINEFIDELETLYVNISNQALDHIHSRFVSTHFLATTTALSRHRN